MLWIKATQQKFEHYGQYITTERQLQDGDYIKHLELVGENGQFFVDVRMDTAVLILTDDEMDSLIKNEPIVN